MAAANEATTVPEPQKRLNSKQRRELRRKGGEVTNAADFRFVITPLKPLTENQKKVWNLFPKSKIMMLDGYPGTGKTFTSLYLSICEVMAQQEVGSGCSKILVVRSAVQTRNQGFMPGDQKEKMANFEEVYDGICAKLFQRSDAYKILKSRAQISMTSTSFLRGVSIDDTIIIVDECQSMNYHELRTVFTRLGTNSKIIFCGDETQDDLKVSGTNRNDRSGMAQFRQVLKRMGIQSIVTFGAPDIVRSSVIKDFILAEEELKKEGVI